MLIEEFEQGYPDYVVYYLDDDDRIKVSPAADPGRIDVSFIDEHKGGETFMVLNLSMAHIHLLEDVLQKQPLKAPAL